MYKVFIDGEAGTTGLKIAERFAGRNDVELLHLPPEKRKDAAARKEMINRADYCFLCLPDEAAKEACSLVENENVKIIDASTAHRTAEGWAYGFPELDEKHFSDVKNSSRVAVPGCHASGFLALVYPLIAAGIVDSDYPFVCYSMSGYSGGGKSAIARYDARESVALEAPGQYALTQNHKHIKEMQYVGGVMTTPVFSPFICDFYSGMEVTVPIFGMMMRKCRSVDALYDFYSEYYSGQKFITVEKCREDEFIYANSMSGRDSMKILIGGNDKRILPVALYDNLGKGASGAAIECMNIMMGLPPERGLVL